MLLELVYDKQSTLGLNIGSIIVPTQLNSSELRFGNYINYILSDIVKLPTKITLATSVK